MPNITGRVRLSNNPLLPAPQDFDFEILSSNGGGNGGNQPPPPSNGQDMIDLSTVTINSSPKDIHTWPITIAIKGIVMRSGNDSFPGLSFQFDKVVPENWKYFTHPPSDDNFQYTVWACANYNGRISGAAFIQMWQGRINTGAPILTDFHTNWAYSSRWGDLNLYLPKVGDQMGFMVSAGNGRDQNSVTSVRERSNVVIAQLPVGDNGSFSY